MGVVSIGNARARTAPAAPRSGGPVVPVPAPATGRVAAILPALVLLLAGLAALAWASLPPLRPGVQVVVIAAPGTSRLHTLAMVVGAQGALVAPGRLANVAFAISPRADFPAALRREGIWFVFAAPRLAGCLGVAKDDLAP
jgi:hypothetical protein